MATGGRPFGSIPEDVPEEEDDNSTLPPFANAENKAIDKGLRLLERNLEAADTALEENHDRIAIMDEHLKNVHTELKFTQSRLEAKTKEIDSEKHLKSLADREMGRLSKDIGKLVSEREELRDKVAGFQAQIYRANEKLDGFKLLMNWNQEELEQWALAQRQKDEDNAAMEKYKHQDTAKVKELSLSLEKMSRAVVNRRQDLEQEVLETQAAQIQLDKTAEDFRKLHSERQELIRQWDEAMEAMRHRDTSITVASEEYTAKKATLRAAKADLDAQARFLENESVNNKEVDARIAFYDREIARQREQFLQEQKRLEEMNNEVEAIKATLSKAATELAQQGNENDAARTTLDDKRTKLDASRKKYAVLRRKLDDEFNALDSLEAKVEEMESMRRNDEARLKAVLKETEELKKDQFKRSQKLFELRTKERQLISEISGGQGQNKNMASRIAALDEQVVRQQELLYNVEFQLQQMERKVARAQGNRSEEETRALNARIEKITTVLEVVNQEHSMLLEQVKHSEDDLLKARRANGSLRGERTKLEEAAAALRLENEMVNRQVKNSASEKEKLLVDHDVMKLEVKRLRDILSMHADEVFSLENRKFQMEMSAQERRHEVEVHRDSLRIELRLLREDIHRITLELRERALKVEKLQSKFEVISSKTRGNGQDENGEPYSQAYYVIKAAQEREELQREGDALDGQIRQAESEVAALEATLLQLMTANSKFNGTYKKVAPADAFGERAILREKLDKVYDKLKFKRQEETVLAGDCSQVNTRLSGLAAEQRAVEQALSDLNIRHAEAQRQVQDQSEKLARAKRSTGRAAQALGLPMGPDGQVAHEADAAKEATLGEMREVARSMLAELAGLAQQYPEANIRDVAEQHGLRLPSSAAGPLGTPPSQTPGGSRAGTANGGSRPQSGRSAVSGVSRPTSIRSQRV